MLVPIPCWYLCCCLSIRLSLINKLNVYCGHSSYESLASCTTSTFRKSQKPSLGSFVLSSLNFLNTMSFNSVILRELTGGWNLLSLMSRWQHAITWTNAYIKSTWLGFCSYNFRMENYNLSVNPVLIVLEESISSVDPVPIVRRQVRKHLCISMTFFKDHPYWSLWFLAMSINIRRRPNTLREYP